MLREKGIATRRWLGQNFLVDPNFLSYLVRTAGISRQDFVLEIGSGPGWFTSLLAEKCRYVWGVEIDRKLFALSRELFGSLPNISFINADILDRKSDRLNPIIVKQIKEATTNLRVVANLPFRRAATIILALLESNLKIAMMYVMIQQEMAERLVAKPARKAYGALTVLVQTLAEVRVIRHIPPEVFFPKPRVVSTLISITPKSSRLLHEIKPEIYQEVKGLIRTFFRYRRKTIGRIIKELSSRPKVEPVLEKSGISLSLRPGEIPPEAYLSLAKNFTKNLK